MNTSGELKEQLLRDEVIRLQRELQDERESRVREVAELQKRLECATLRHEVEDRIVKGLDALAQTGAPPAGFWARLFRK